MVASEMAICYSQSDQFNSRSNRTMTGKCSSWTRTPQGENMPVSLKTPVERTAKTPVTACHARVGGLCGFCSPAERAPIQQQKTRRCADVRERCGNAKRRRRTPPGRFQQREKPQAAIAGERPDAFLRLAVHFCPQCGQFRGMKMALFCGCQKWNDAVIS